ncbi:MAG TPA: FAD binding domain-containing protein [Gemmatimonadaceae bacterium]|nr:FAD binding domain-containing protein [Gemmatimonadaceae bacterium]
MSGFEFAYERPTSLESVLEALAASGSVAIGGGTDLLVLVEEGLAKPQRVVDVRAYAGAGDIELRADGSARIGGAARIADVAAHQGLRAHFPVLAEACGSVGTPALRNMGTLGGNLAQRQRCWYFRRGVTCFKNGGDACAAVAGENQYHGIVAEGPCRAVHPSDPAVALLALGARVAIASKSGSRTIALEELYAGAEADRERDVMIASDELVTAIELDAAAADGAQHWEKLMQRGAWDFALVACAAARRTDGSVRMALGGVGLGPWRVPSSIEEDVSSGGLDPESIDALAERALYDVEPLAKNAYKVEMARALLRRAVGAIG